jgi:hypothetical protein
MTQPTPTPPLERLFTQASQQSTRLWRLALDDPQALDTYQAAANERVWIIPCTPRSKRRVSYMLLRSLRLCLFPAAPQLRTSYTVQHQALLQALQEPMAPGTVLVITNLNRFVGRRMTRERELYWLSMLLEQHIRIPVILADTAETLEQLGEVIPLRQPMSELPWLGTPPPERPHQPLLPLSESEYEEVQRWAISTDKATARRGLLLLALAATISYEEAQATTGLNRSTLRSLIKRFNIRGLEGVRIHKPSMSLDLAEPLETLIQRPPYFYGKRSHTWSLMLALTVLQEQKRLPDESNLHSLRMALIQRQGSLWREMADKAAYTLEHRDVKALRRYFFQTDPQTQSPGAYHWTEDLVRQVMAERGHERADLQTSLARVGLNWEEFTGQRTLYRRLQNFFRRFQYLELTPPSCGSDATEWTPALLTSVAHREGITPYKVHESVLHAALAETGLTWSQATRGGRVIFWQAILEDLCALMEYPPSHYGREQTVWRAQTLLDVAHEQGLIPYIAPARLLYKALRRAGISLAEFMGRNDEKE